MEYTWLVEKYLEGELGGEALRNFELEILTKPEVAEEVERIRSLNRFMKQQHKNMHRVGGLIEDFDDIDNVLHEDEVRKEFEDLKIRKISASREDLIEIRSRLTESEVRNTLNTNQSDK